MIYIGIDPGEKKGDPGAVAIWDPGYMTCPIIEDCPQIEEAMAEILLEYPIENLRVTLEKAPKIMKIQGKTYHPTILYGNYRAWKGILAVLNVSHHLKYDIVHPRTWQTILDTNRKFNTKERAMEMACRLYPEVVPLLRGPRGAKKFGRSDAMIIMEYGKRKIWVCK